MGFFDAFTGGHGILGRKGLKHERELTDTMVDQVSNDHELAGELAPLLGQSSTPMTVEQHRAYRATITGRANDIGTVRAGLLGFRTAQSHLRGQAASADNLAQLDIMDTQADYAHRLLVSMNPKLQEAGTQLMAKVLQSQQDFATTNEAQRLAQETQQQAAQQALGPQRWAAFSGLQDNYRAESAPFLAQRAAIGTVNAALQEPSAAGDVSLLFAYMKLLDPGSVVREGEFATAQNTSGVPEIVMTAYNRLMRDGERLTPQQRKDFYSQAVKSFAVARDGQIERNTRYLGQARDVGLPESMLSHFTLPLEALGVAPTGFGTDKAAAASAPAGPQPAQTDTPARMVGDSLRDSLVGGASTLPDFLRGLFDVAAPAPPGAGVVAPAAHLSPDRVDELTDERYRGALARQRAKRPPIEDNDYPRRGIIQRRQVNE